MMYNYLRKRCAWRKCSPQASHLATCTMGRPATSRGRSYPCPANVSAGDVRRDAQLHLPRSYPQRTGDRLMKIFIFSGKKAGRKIGFLLLISTWLDAPHKVFGVTLQRAVSFLRACGHSEPWSGCSNGQPFWQRSLYQPLRPIICQQKFFLNRVE